MKRLVLIVFCLFLTASVAAAARDQLSSETRNIVEKALANEQEAVARYNAYALKATEEGYLGAASLFRACARAESIHAQRFAEVLGMATLPERTFDITVRSTDDNLRTSLAAETAERDSVYHDAIATARRHGEDKVAKLFDETRDVETEHANLQAAAMRDLSNMKAPNDYYVCERCGYTTEINLPRCPSCQHAAHLSKVQ